MLRTDIEKELMKNDSTVLSFPNRGSRWGSNQYRGNCSGWIHAFLIWKYQVQKMAELFSGSGTGYDVAKDMGIKYVGADLNPNPVRPGILNVNAITDEVPNEFFDADMVFMHPPYGAEINIPYAGSMYPDLDGSLSLSDLGQMPWDKFMRTLNEVIIKYYTSMESGSRMAILMGDVRRNGKCHSMLTDIVKPGQLDQIIIKMQHNCVSNGRTYAAKNFVPLVHEYIMVLKKIAPYIINYQLPQAYEMDIRDSVKTATWKDVVASVCRKYNRPVSLTEIYSEIQGHKKCSTNENWQAKVRQTLQLYPIFSHVSEGKWQMTAA